MYITHHCPHCGHANAEDSFYCHHCDKSLSADVVHPEQYVQPGVSLQHEQGVHAHTPNAYTGSVTPPSHTDRLIGRLIGNFRIIEKIGQGGFGAVYRAEQIHIRKHFAIKVLHLNKRANQELVERFRREAVAIADLQHDNVVQLSDFGVLSEEEGFYMVMEFLVGTTLHQSLASQEPFDNLRISGIMQQICSVLHHAHRKGIIHRDLKPPNIFLINNDMHVDKVKVIDFGIAAVAEDDGIETQSGMMMGSPYYMSPEQAMGQKDQVDRRSDLYALGIILYQLLTGTTPFRGQGTAVLLQHVQTRPPRLEQIIPYKHWAPELEHFLERVLAKYPHLRPADASEFWQQCKQALDAQEAIDSSYESRQSLSSPARAGVIQPPSAPTMSLSQAQRAGSVETPVPFFRPPDVGVELSPTQSLYHSTPLVPSSFVHEPMTPRSQHGTLPQQSQPRPASALRSSTSKPVMMGLIIVGILGVMGLILYLVLQQPPSASLWINSSPQQASVSQQGKVLGETPYFYQGTLHEKLSFQLRLKNYKTRTVVYTLKTVEAKERFALTPLLSTWRIQSQPANAAVFIGGLFVGRTPLAIQKAPNDRILVRLLLDGYQPFDREYTFSLQNTRNTFALVPMQKPKPIPAPIRERKKPRVVKPSVLILNTKPSGAIVRLNGTKIGKTPFRWEKMGVQRIHITITHPGYIRENLSIPLRPGVQRRIITLKPITLVQ